MHKDLSIVLSGEAGQGLQAVEKILTPVCKLAGFHVFATKEVMSRVRGGVNSTSLRISSEPVTAYVDRIDLLIPLSQGRTKHLLKRVSKKTLVLGEDFAGHKYANTLAAGVICGVLNIPQQILNDQVNQIFQNKGDQIIKDNLEAAGQGRELGQQLKDSGKLKLQLKPAKHAGLRTILNGAQAVGMGAIAGGCNFISAYPMSPSTGVLVYLSQHAKEAGIIAEQAEDEISAINMGLGAWYAGGRALVSTSGGGFALMQESVSLAGMTETPIVIHLAQRPGPATGLPTRTEQGDLNLALYSGHGEFPRIILTPGNIQEAFYLTQKAFNLADKYQVPVFVLTDQYLMDSYYDLEAFDKTGQEIKQYIVETKVDYQRYEITKSGVSPRGIPGNGEGLVCVDSDEHDKAGHITEDLELRVKMVNKRMMKGKSLLNDLIGPELIGPKDYKTLVIAWGSTKEMISEALRQISNKRIALLHFKQVYPLPDIRRYLNKADKVIAVENNSTGQFADLVELQTGFKIKDRVLKYNGLPFSVEELSKRLR